MLMISRSQFNGTTQALRARVAAFIEQMGAHALTVGVPAPLEDELIVALARSGEDFEVEQAPAQPVTADPPTPDQVKAEQWAKIRALRDARTQNGGYPAAGKWFHSDTFSRTQQLGLVLLGANIPAGTLWKTMDGSFVAMTQTLASQVFQSAAAQDAATFAAAEAHKAAMEAASDPAAYDFSTGWPPIFGE